MYTAIADLIQCSTAGGETWLWVWDRSRRTSPSNWDVERNSDISGKKTILPWQISHDLKILVMYCIYTVYTSLTIFTISCYKIHAQKTDSWNKVPFKFTMGRLPDILTDTKRWPDLTMPLRNLNNRTHSSGIRWGATWKWRISTLTHYKIVHISLQHLISSL